MDQDPSRIEFPHFLLAAIPAAATPLLVFAVAEGWMNFGGGEKDLLLAIPYVLWATIFFVTGFVLIVKKWRLRSWLLRVFAVSVGVLFSAWVLVFVLSWSGVAS